jgi:hypothetical protein
VISRRPWLYGIGLVGSVTGSFRAKRVGPTSVRFGLAHHFTRMTRAEGMPSLHPIKLQSVSSDRCGRHNSTQKHERKNDEAKQTRCRNLK